MRKLILLLAILLSSSAMAEDLKIGVVNPAKVLDEAPQALAARDQLEKEFAPRDRELREMQESLMALEEKMSRDSAIMSEEQRRQLDREILSQRRDVKRFQDEFREDLNMRRNEEFGKLQQNIIKAISALAEKEGYDLILGEGVIYANDKVDLSQKLVKQLQADFKKVAQ